MKKIILFLIVLFCSISFGQGWNSTVTTTINESSLEKMDLFTNKNGNHILIKRTNGNIVYYNLSSSGTVDNNKTVTLEYNGDFPNIVGSNDIVYAIFQSGNYIKVRYTTNGGSSWQSSVTDRQINPYPVNGIDAAYEKDYGVHLVWATRDNDTYFETYYIRLNTFNQWVDFKNVTDVTNFQDGGRPTVTYSPDRVHVSFNNENYGYQGGYISTRDRLNGNWQTPQSVPTDFSYQERTLTRGSFLYIIYSRFEQGPPGNYVISYLYRNLSGNWTSSTGGDIESVVQPEFKALKSANDNLHAIYVRDDANNDFKYEKYDGSWSGLFTIDPNQSTAIFAKGFSNASNDLFVTWKRYDNNYLKYRQYDAIPLAPQNLTVESYVDGAGFTHPKLI